MGTDTPPSPLAAIAELAAALDRDDLDAVMRHLHAGVVYEIGGETHRGASAVVESYRSGSASAREVFDDVEYDHDVLGLVGDRTVRVDFSDRLTADGEVFEHHSVQDMTVDRTGRVTYIVDQPVEGQRSRLEEFMARHHRVRPPSRRGV
jgi:hypothetical protein